MKRMLKLMAVVLAGLTVAILAYDRSRAHDDAPWFGSATLQPASATTTSGYRIEAAPKAVIDLGRNRMGAR